MLSKNMTCSARTDCKASVDVVLRSSEGTFIGAHSDFLNIYSTAFKDLITPSLEPIQMTEREEVLVQMLQFMHPGTHPKLDEIPTSLLVDLAEAVEKWKVITAQEACRLAMSSQTHVMPIHVLLYARNHGHHELLEKAARESVSVDLESVATIIASRGSKSLDVFMAWARYREAILTASNEVRKRFQNKHCGSWRDWFYLNANRDIVDLLPKLPSEKEMYDIMERHSGHIHKCKECMKAMDDWKKAIREEVYHSKKLRFINYL